MLNKGFYSKELILTFSGSMHPYLIFVPNNSKIRSELNQMEEATMETRHSKLKLDINQTTLKNESTLRMLKQIFGRNTDKLYDWMFVTNQTEIDFGHIIASYKRKWKLEDGFKLQDETRIKSKSTDANIRFFYFCYEHMLHFIWIILFKDKVNFKTFMINLYEECLKRSNSV